MIASHDPYWPEQQWRRATPAEQGIDTSYLVRLFQFVERQRINLNSLLIVRNGYLVTEAYFEPHDADTLHDMASATKSVTAMLVGVALQQGLLHDTGQQLREFFPELAGSRKGLITLAHVLSMTTGLRWREGGIAYTSRANTFTQMTRSKDWIEFILRQPITAPAGTQFAYNSGSWQLLAALLQRISGETAAEFARKHLFDPLGINASIWPANPAGITLGSSWLRLSALSMTRLGYLYLQGGRWQEQQIVAADYVHNSTRPAASRVLSRRLSPRKPPPSPSELREYGWGWWLPSFGGFAARGYAGQVIFVLPAANLVVVMTAGLPNSDPFLPERLIYSLILPALKQTAPLSPQPEYMQELDTLLLRNASTRPAAVPLAPPIAQQISGRTYKMQPNTAHVRSARLIFDLLEATLVLRMRGATYTTKLGLDGAFRRNTLPDGTTLALRGEWENEVTFVVESRSTRTGDIFSMRFRFEQQRVVLQTSTLVGGDRTHLTGIVSREE